MFKDNQNIYHIHIPKNNIIYYISEWDIMHATVIKNIPKKIKHQIIQDYFDKIK